MKSCLLDILRSEVNEKFSKRSLGVTVHENGQIAVHKPSPGHEYVLGENAHQRAWDCAF